MATPPAIGRPLVQVLEGAIPALLGQNGAGKTTTVRLLAAAVQVPVLAIISLSRTACGERAPGSSKIVALKEAGELEYHCWAVLFLREPEQRATSLRSRVGGRCCWTSP